MTITGFVERKEIRNVFSLFVTHFFCFFFSRTAVSGAHNTIVTARAGKDLISSLVSGLLTIVSISK